MSNWEKFQKKQQQTTEPVPSRPINGMYQCHFCPRFVFEGTYYPTDSILKYKCSEGHTSFVENFKVAF